MNNFTPPQPTQTNPHEASRRWPEGAVVYHIYPRSFMDSNGDGVGDLAGILGKLDYLQELGIQAIWLSPFYPSPMVDFGYDVADYCNVDPLFGTLDDFKALVTAAHERGIRLLVDLVANHTSDAHAWFQESRSSRTNPKADWYIWRDPKHSLQPDIVAPPNNWRDALIGESAWQWDEHRQQYYLHSWHRRQPDLNWQNKAVRQAIKSVMRFWLDLGVDGFRADAVDWIAKDPLLRDDSPNDEYAPSRESPYDALKHDNSRGWPTEYDYLAEMTAVFDEPAYKDRQLFLIAETYHERHNLAESYLAFYGGLDPEHAAPFNFEGLYLPWEAGTWRRFLRAFHGGLKLISGRCVPSYAFGNHDNPRIISRLGEQRAKAAALFQLTLPGMIYIYYGEELGMTDAQLPAGAMHDVYYRSRDPARTPMQWSAEPGAGFSTAARTWLPVNANYTERNLATEQQNPLSYFAFYRQLIRMRAASEALRYGDIQILEVGHPDILGFIRWKGTERLVIFVNFSDRPVSCVPGVTLSKLLLSTELHTKLVDGTNSDIELLPNEAALFLQ